MPALARRWPAIGLAPIAGVFAWAVCVAVDGHDLFEPTVALMLAAVFAVVLGLVAVALWIFAPRVRAIGVIGVACVAASVALLATAPVDFPYDDGCNDHETLAPAVVVPALAALRPDRAEVAYVDTSTLMACFDGPALR